MKKKKNDWQLVSNKLIEKVDVIVYHYRLSCDSLGKIKADCVKEVTAW